MKSIKVIIISISVTTFLLTHLSLSISYADSEIAALGNLKGVYVNLKIHYRSLQGMKGTVSIKIYY